MDRLTREKIEVLRMVRKLIAQRTFTFICHALTHVMQTSPKLCTAAVVLKLYVRNALHPNDTLFDWANATTCMDWQDWDGVAARLAWIDWMINQLEEGQ